MRVSDTTTFEYDFNFGETTAGGDAMEVEERITVDSLYAACDPKHCSLVIVSPRRVLLKVDARDGCATPAMIQLAIVAQKLASLSEEAFITHIRNTIMVIRQPGAHNPFQVPEEEHNNPELTEAIVRRFSLDEDDHVVVIMQNKQGAIVTHSQFATPFKFNSKLQILFSVAKSIETNAAGVFASIASQLENSDQVILDRISQAVDAL